MHPEALILRRCYPVPVSFADLRAAADLFLTHTPSTRSIEAQGIPCRNIRAAWTKALKQVTGAIDEVYAVVDGHEVRVGYTVGDGARCLVHFVWAVPGIGYKVGDLLEVADRAGYWERPHEVRLDLSPRPVSHGEVARAVLVGQEALERGGVVRS